MAVTLPFDVQGKRQNEGVLIERGGGQRRIHVKSALPDEEGFHEARWFHRGLGGSETATCGDARLGFLICSELWFIERARSYGRESAHLLLVPRATSPDSLERWRLVGRVAALASGAFCLSSNRVGGNPGGPSFGGEGWVISPEGDVLVATSAARPFATVEIDLDAAVRAKLSYPRTLAE